MVTVALRSHSGWGSSGVDVFWTVQWGLAWDREAATYAEIRGF